MFNPHTRFEVSIVTCNEDMKGNAKFKNSRFEPPFGDLGVTHKVHLLLDGKSIVDFLLGFIMRRTVRQSSSVNLPIINHLG